MFGASRDSQDELQVVVRVFFPTQYVSDQHKTFPVINDVEDPPIADPHAVQIAFEPQ